MSYERELLVFIKKHEPEIIERYEEALKFKNKFQYELKSLIGKRVRTTKSGFGGSSGVIRTIKKIGSAGANHSAFYLADTSKEANNISLSFLKPYKFRLNDVWYLDFKLVEEKG